jgi:Carboxypeptidase regulatory-like domain
MTTRIASLAATLVLAACASTTSRTVTTTSISTVSTSATTTSPAPTSAPGRPPGAGAYGIISAGPTCPVERVGRPCPPGPVSAEVNARTASGQTVATAHSDAHGDYRLSLAPGRYTLVVVTSSIFPRCPDTPVSVTDGVPTRADISCDTGIR